MKINTAGLLKGITGGILVSLPVIGTFCASIKNELDKEKATEELLSTIKDLNDQQKEEIITSFEKQIENIKKISNGEKGAIKEKVYSFQGINIDFNNYVPVEIMDKEDLENVKEYISDQIYCLYDCGVDTITYANGSWFVGMIDPIDIERFNEEDIYSIFTFENVEEDDEDNDLCYLFYNEEIDDIPIIRRISIY